jgi:hypothetical protein
MISEKYSERRKVDPPRLILDDPSDTYFAVLTSPAPILPFFKRCKLLLSTLARETNQNFGAISHSHSPEEREL